MGKDKLIGVLATVIFHGLLLTLCFSGGLKYLYPPPEEKSMVIEFEREDEPQVNIEAGNEPRSEDPDPEKEVNLVKRAEAPVEGKKANESEEATVGEDGDVEIPEPVHQIEKRALFPSAANNRKDTLSTQRSISPSDALAAGHAAGNTSTGSTDGEPSARLAGRNVIGSLPLPSYSVQKSGRVVVKITVDRSGTVTSAIPGDIGTTVNDRTLWAAAKQAALKAKFNTSNNAPQSQDGTITYIFRLN